MPEIKHNFTKGRMNKDLDERLIPNGEYRDAMNIQVSTSEGADVGALQNILGNSLVDGQENILVGASCVGSIADEKNDKLYWFITNSDIRIIDLIDQSMFAPSYTRIVNNNMIVEYDVSSNITSPVFVDDTRIAISAQGGGLYECPATPMLKIHNASGIETGMYVHGIDTHGVTIFSSTVTSVGTPVTITGPPPVTSTEVNLVDNPCSYGPFSIETFTSTMWYVFSWHVDATDSQGILNFKRGEYITGINIIDDMLFWTDNNSEPKKINVSRCKAGTANFNTQTKLINDSQNIDIISNISTREDHITVIKKSPPTPPVVTLESERDPTKEYTGVMRITPPFVGGMTANPSSFSVWSTGSTRYDFSGLKVGDTFKTEIETNLDGNSGFVLDWEPGDTVLLREFDGDEPPSVPITDYTIKAKINPELGWNMGASPPTPIYNRFTDTSNELLQNGDFIIPHISGNKPEGWTPHTGSGVTYSAFNNKLVFDGPHQWWKIRTTDNIPIVGGEEYKVEFTLSDVTAGLIQGYLVIPNPGGGSQVYNTAQYNTNGTHTETLILSPKSAAGWNATNYENKFFLQATGYGEFDGYDGLPELVDMAQHGFITLGTTVGYRSLGDAWEITSANEISFDYTQIDDTLHASANYQHILYFKDIMIENLMNGVRYELDLEVAVTTAVNSLVNYDLGIRTQGGVGGSARFDQDDFSLIPSGGPVSYGTPGFVATKTIEFTANSSTEQIDIYVRSNSSPGIYALSGHQIATQWNAGQNRDKIILDAVPSKPVVVGIGITVLLVQSLPPNTTVTGYEVAIGGGFAVVTISNDTTGPIPAATVFHFDPGNEINSEFGVSFDMKVTLKKEKGFTGNVENVSVESLSELNARASFEVIAMNGTPPIVPNGEIELKYAIDKQDKDEKIFEFKFPRFATRYKYEDGEYSAFSPFSEVAFLPGSFDYHPKKGYNLGMTNRIKNIHIKNIGLHIPSDVVSIDILYKDENSPNIYIVDTIKPNDWGSDYTIKSESISRVIPSNQLLRPWDNVPRKALAQDIVGNRLVYGNYLQGYDLTNIFGSDYHPNINFNFINSDVTNSARSVKSQREYQVGVVFVDKHGRETPVLSNQNATSKLSKNDADKANKMSVDFGDHSYMKDMEYFKFFVKEISGEYYNMAMDRWYDAEDDHVWVSFPSSDRNKIDIDTFLILKKGVETDELVTDPARYKVIAIENEAPDFIKTKKTLIEEREHIFATVNIFGNTTNNAPLSGRDSFQMNYRPFVNSSGANLHELSVLNSADMLYVEFGQTGKEITSERYRITSLSTDWDGTSATVSSSTYNIKLDKLLGDDVDFITDTIKIIDTVVVKIYRYRIESGSEFDGRFFVKLLNDETFVKNIAQNVAVSPKYRVLSNKKLYSMRPDHLNTHRATLTGQEDGLYAEKATSGSNFGRFAPFFRNYKSEDTTIRLKSNTTAEVSVNQYVFGSAYGTAWENEFLEFTSSGSDSWQDGWDTSNIEYIDGEVYGPWRDASNLKRADKVLGGREAVWFIDAGPFTGRRTSNNSLHWKWIGQGNSVHSGINHPPNKDYFNLNIAMGGIAHTELAGVDAGDNWSIGDFFSIGKDSGNPYYKDNNTVQLVNKFFPARQFRFREDPNANIYTVQPNVSDRNYLRYHDGSDPEGTDEPGYQTTFPWTPNTITGNRNQIAQLSPNFTKNWILRAKNQDEENTHIVKWDPTNDGNLGPIQNGGLILTIDHHGSDAEYESLTAPFELAVRVSSLNATHADGTTHRITTGMMLTSHSGKAAVADTLDGNTDKEFLVIWKIVKINPDNYHLFLTGYSQLLTTSHELYSTNPPVVSTAMVFQQPAMNGYSQWSANRINANATDFSISTPGLMAIGYTIEFIEPIEVESELPNNPAIWETEPKELDFGLDIYYEASGLNPLRMTTDNKNLVIPIGSTVRHAGSDLIPSGTVIKTATAAGRITLGDANGNQQTVPIGISTSGVDYILEGSKLEITKPDGSSVNYTITSLDIPIGSGSLMYTDALTINTNLYGGFTTYNLNWYNCYSFGNGVESNRIGDNFNLPYISNGVKVSTTLEEGEYKEEHRKYGLIYSGLYNTIPGINNLNQFIMAEKITKDINPIYGSIQKLHTRDTDLVTLCEDKVLRILASKDALYNADGNPQLIATDRVLGQTVPFIGEYGISKNPESFVSEAYRSYFTDKQRGTVMRLSKDGLTPISMHGMKDWFRDNLKLYGELIGSYDDRNDEYNLTLREAISVVPKTVSFREDVTGWVSFKSFTPENAISCANDYFTMLNGKLYKHYDESVDRNTFYSGIPNYGYTNSSVNVMLNEQPGSIKSFHTLDYEGSQSRVEGIKTVEVTGVEHYYPSTNPGRYFFFDVSDMNDTLNNTNWYADIIEMKQYRNNILVHTGLMRLWDNSSINSQSRSPSGGPTKGHGRRSGADGSVSGGIGDFQVGDIITTQQQEKTVNYFNSMPKDGWYVSSIVTDKQEGSLNEFIEKEGKWFNHIKGIDSEISETTNFGSFDIQGIGIVSGTNLVTVDGIVYSLVDGTNPFNYPDGMFFYIDAQEFDILVDVANVTLEPTGVGGVRGSSSKIVEQYRNDTLVWSGLIRIWNDPLGGGIHGRKLTGDTGGDWQVGDVIKIENTSSITFTNNINSSLQIGDTLYFERPSEVLADDIVDMNEFTGQSLLSFPGPGPSST